MELSEDIEQVKSLLLSNPRNNLVVKKGSDLKVIKKKGITPVLDLCLSKANYQGAVCADRIVGKAAALLYVYLGVHFVYGHVLSREAQKYFERYHILYEYEFLVDMIVNKTNDDFDPLDKAVADLDEIETAPQEIQKVLKTL